MSDRHGDFDASPADDLPASSPTPRQDTLSRDHHGPRAILNALERLASGYAVPCEAAQQELSIAQAQLRDYQSRLGAPFPHEAYLSQLAALRDQLKAGLSDAAPEPGTEPPKISDIAEQIKALKGTQSIEAAPQRTAKRRGSAEEPVTARIRRRTELKLDSTPSKETDAAPSSPEAVPVPATSSLPVADQTLSQAANPQPAKNHQEQLARSRQRRQRQLTLF